MDPPAESGQAPATDKTTGNFEDQTCVNFSDQTSVTPYMGRPKIVLWGDSLTQTGFDGWVGKLAHQYQRRADVLNRGMSGYNSTWWLQLPEESVENTCLCLIWFGANDASLPDLNPHHYVSVEDYQANLKTLVEKSKTLLNSPPLLLLTPPPVDHAQRLAFQKERYGEEGATGDLERTLENSGKYATACQEVATELGVPCIHLWNDMQAADPDNWAKFLSDGLHFSPEGHEYVFQQILKAIATHYPTLVVTPDPATGQCCNSGTKCEGIPTFGPYHDDIDETAPDVAMKLAFKNMALKQQQQTNDGNTAAAATKSPTTKKAKMDAP